MKVENIVLTPEVIEEQKKSIIDNCLADAKPLIATKYKNGILLIGENPNKSLAKISEIHDKIAFAASGIYSNIVKLKNLGIKYASVVELDYSSKDVDAVMLAQQYALTLSNFYDDGRLLPLRIEIILAEIENKRENKNIFKILSNGALIEEDKYAVIPDIYKVNNDKGENDKFIKDTIKMYLKDKITGEEDLRSSINICLGALSHNKNKEVRLESLELAVLKQEAINNKNFKKYSHQDIKNILNVQ